MSWKDEMVISRNGKEVEYATGSVRRCQMEGCNGHRIRVVWADGKWTWPCTHGLKFIEELQAWRII